MDYKKTKAPSSTITRDIQTLEKGTNNIYESIAIIAKRADQIETDLKKELDSKLEEFASVNDTLEETFENREQIEISKFYEKLPNPVLIAIEEFLDDKIYYRMPEEEESSSATDSIIVISWLEPTCASMPGNTPEARITGRKKMARAAVLPLKF